MHALCMPFNIVSLGQTVTSCSPSLAEAEERQPSRLKCWVRRVGTGALGLCFVFLACRVVVQGRPFGRVEAAVAVQITGPQFLSMSLAIA